MKRKGRRTGLFAMLLSLTMLLSSVPVFAAERPTRPSEPTWGDVMDLIAYVEAETEGAAWYSEEEWNHALHNWEPAGKKLVHQEIGDEFYDKVKEWLWDVDRGDIDDTYILTDDHDDKEHYFELYDLAVELIDSMETAIGDYYWGDDVEPLIWDLDDAYAGFWRKADELGEIAVIGDDEEPLEGQEWIYSSALEQLRKEHDDFYDNHWHEEWDYVTREECLELITMLRTALNNLQAAKESGKGNFTLDIPGETPAETPTETPTTPAETPSETPEPSSEVSAPAAAETVTETPAAVTIPATSSVGTVKSTVGGAFAVKKVNGIAFTTPVSNITAGYQLASGEKAHALVWDLDPKKSNLAQAVIDNTAAALGAEVGPALNLELGKKDAAGRYSLLSQDGAAVQIAVGVPASFVENGKTLAVVRVRPGGAVSILKDLDTDPATVTFETTGGAGAYAIVKY